MFVRLGNPARISRRLLTLGVVAFMLVMSVGCAPRTRDNYRQGDSITFGNAYKVTVTQGWTATWDTVEESGQPVVDRLLVVRGPNQERVDIFPSTKVDALSHLSLERKLIDSGDLDGAISRVTLFDEPADVMVGVLDESSGEHMVLAYLWGSQQPLGLQAYGFAEVERMISRGAPAEEILAEVVREIGLGHSSVGR